jgi:hypothetical protein
MTDSTIPWLLITNCSKQASKQATPPQHHNRLAWLFGCCNHADAVYTIKLSEQISIIKNALLIISGIIIIYADGSPPGTKRQM